MRPHYITSEFLDQFIKSALAEDIGDGDHSTLAAIPSNSIKKARLLVKEDGILAGVELAEQIFHFFDPTLKVDVKLADGRPVKKGEIAFTVEGSAQSILTTERLVLNCMQRMSAIATKTHYLSIANYRHEGQNPGYPQNDTKLSPFGKMGGFAGWWT